MPQHTHPLGRVQSTDYFTWKGYPLRDRAEDMGRGLPLPLSTYQVPEPYLPLGSNIDLRLSSRTAQNGEDDRIGLKSLCSLSELLNLFEPLFPGSVKWDHNDTSPPVSIVGI